MITNNFNKELRGISDALRDLGYSKVQRTAEAETHSVYLDQRRY